MWQKTHNEHQKYPHYEVIYIDIRYNPLEEQGRYFRSCPWSLNIRIFINETPVLYLYLCGFSREVRQIYLLLRWCLCSAGWRGDANLYYRTLVTLVTPSCYPPLKVPNYFLNESLKITEKYCTNNEWNCGNKSYFVFAFSTFSQK